MDLTPTNTEQLQPLWAWLWCVLVLERGKRESSPTALHGEQLLIQQCCPTHSQSHLLAKLLGSYDDAFDSLTSRKCQ
jgi:hypothetical protein